LRPLEISDRSQPPEKLNPLMQVKTTLVLTVTALLLVALNSDATGTAMTSGRSAQDSDRLQAISGRARGPATARDPSGQPMPVGSVTGWHQVFDADFTTNVPLGGFSRCRWHTDLIHSKCRGLPRAVAAKWWAYPDGWRDTTRNGEYAPSRVLSIHNGLLDFDIHSVHGTPLVAAPEPKIRGGVAGGGLLYGAYAIRFKANTLPGYKTAWLLWPDAYDDGGAAWPSDGEIDFPEGDLNSNMSAFMHWMGASNARQQDAYSTPAAYYAWHTAVVEWTPSMVRFILDGRVIGTSTAHIPSTPMHWVLQTETATDGTVPTAGTAGHVLVAWVAVYTPTAA
jgi:hypothetical protein